MKLIKKIQGLLDKLQKLFGELSVTISNREEKKESVRQDKLYNLRLNRGLKELDVTPIKRGPARLLFSNLVAGGMSREQALWQVLDEQAKKDSVPTNRFDVAPPKTVSGKTEKAYKSAMQVTIPTLKEKAKAQANGISNGAKQTYTKVRETVVERTNGKGHIFRKVLYVFLWTVLVALLALLLWGLFNLFSLIRDNNSNNNQPQQQQSEPEVCRGGWEMKALEKNTVNDNQFVDGVKEIWDAPVTSGPTEEAKKALLADLEKSKPHISALENFGLSIIPNAWLEPGATIPELNLSTASPELIELYRLRTDIISIIKSQKVNAVTDVSYDYVDDQGNPQHHSVCANDQTIQLAKDIEAVVKLSDNQAVNIPDPENWINRGRQDGTDIIAPYSSPGNIGDTKAIITTMPDGSRFATLAHCGQQIKPDDKDRKKDRDRDRDRHKDKCEKDCNPPKEKPKNPKDDPAPRGNAPKGGGKNEDLGPGKYTAPSETTKPSSQPLVNPNPPKTSPIPKGSKPDPAPAPAPEKAAPTPTKPATGTVPVPGIK